MSPRRIPGLVRKWRTTVLFVAVVLMFVAVTLRDERYNAQQTRRVNQESYKRCIDRKKNIDRTNAAWRDVIEIERHNPFIDDRVRRQRLITYAKFILDQPNCGPHP